MWHYLMPTLIYRRQMQKLATVMAQVELLRSHLESHRLGQEEWADGGDDAPMQEAGGVSSLIMLTPKDW